MCHLRPEARRINHCYQLRVKVMIAPVTAATLERRVAALDWCPACSDRHTRSANLVLRVGMQMPHQLEFVLYSIVF